jgi:hypothetical protein
VILGVILGNAQASAQPSSVLFIGDSHSVGTFGKTLDTLLRAKPSRLTMTVASCGVSPSAFLQGLKTKCGFLSLDLNWKEKRATSARTPLIEDLIETVQPELTIVVLGANLINWATTKPEYAAKQTRELAEKITNLGSECLWVGPPNGRNKPLDKLTTLYDMLKRETKGLCRFFDSRPESVAFLDFEKLAKQAGKSGDGVHYDSLGSVGRTAMRMWAKEVYLKVRQWTLLN